MTTIAIGDKYLQNYNRLFRPSQEAYASKHGYDFKVITNYLDNRVQHPHSISIHKLLICSQEWSSAYDFIVYVDADIVINPNSPPIHEACHLGDKIGMVNEYSQPTLDRRIEVQKKNGWEYPAREYYKLCGYQLETDKMFNGGVMVFQPRKHRSFLEGVYGAHVLKTINHPRGFHFEQTVVNYEFQKADMIITLPNEFNAVWIIWKTDSPSLQLKDFYEKNYFIHLAAGCDHNKLPI